MFYKRERKGLQIPLCDMAACDVMEKMLTHAELVGVSSKMKLLHNIQIWKKKVQENKQKSSYCSVIFTVSI